MGNNNENERKFELPKQLLAVKITESPAGSGNFVCETNFDNRKTATLLMKLAMQYYEYAAIDEYKKAMAKKENGNIINPFSGEYIHSEN